MTNTIAFQRAASTLPTGEEIFDIFLINDDGTGLIQITHHAAGKDFDSFSPVFSPDGTQIVFATMRNRKEPGNNNTSEIYRMAKDGSNVTRLTNDSYDDLSPCWSADGAQILFSGARPDPRLFTMSSTDGSSVSELRMARAGLEDGAPRYSPDGAKITFIRNFGGGRRAVFVADSDGNNARNLTTLPCLCDAPYWSPDGKKIVYSSDHHNPLSNELEIYLMDAGDIDGDGEGDNRARLTNFCPLSTSYTPVFSPDGTRIVYSNNASGKFDIYFMDADGANKASFVNYGGNCFVTDWK
jgi:Tol biopolymer transport system component